MRTHLLPPPDDWDSSQQLTLTKREMTARIFAATKEMDAANPDFRRYWDAVAPVNRDLFISQIVEAICTPQ